MRLLPDESLQLLQLVGMLGAAFLVALLSWDLGRFSVSKDGTLMGYVLHLVGSIRRMLAREVMKLPMESRSSKTPPEQEASGAPPASPRDRASEGEMESRASELQMDQPEVSEIQMDQPEVSEVQMDQPEVSEVQMDPPEQGLKSRSKRWLFDSTMWCETKVTVMLLGVTGAGKSTLANMLVFGEKYPEADGFEVGHTADSQTRFCQSKSLKFRRCTLTVFDTPGVPDTRRDKTLDRFDEIVKAVQGMPSLNAVIFLLNPTRHEERDYEAYKILFAQYKKLPCPLIMMCRVDCRDDPEREKAKKKDAAVDLISRVSLQCDLTGNRVHKLIYRHGKEGEVDLCELRCFLGTVPTSSLAEKTLMTSGEMEKRLSHLSDQAKRMGELKKDIPRLKVIQEKLDAQVDELNDRIQKAEAALKGTGVGTTFTAGIAACVDIALLGMPVATSITVATGGYRAVRLSSQIAQLKGTKKIAESSSSSNEADLNKKIKEVESGKVDPEEVKKAREEYQQILRLRDR